jgi:hypothetical protein
MHCDERGTFFGDDKNTRSLPVDPMDQLEQSCLGSGSPKLLDHPEAHPAAAVHRNACRLVDHQQCIVLEQDRELLARDRRDRIGRCHPDRRDPDHIAKHKSAFGADTGAVDPDLAAADNPVDPTLRDALEQADQKIVESLAGMRVIDANQPDVGRRRRQACRRCIRFCR